MKFQFSFCRTSCPQKSVNKIGYFFFFQMQFSYRKLLPGITIRPSIPFCYIINKIIMSHFFLQCTSSYIFVIYLRKSFFTRKNTYFFSQILFITNYLIINEKNNQNWLAFQITKRPSTFFLPSIPKRSI